MYWGTEHHAGIQLVVFEGMMDTAGLSKGKGLGSVATGFEGTTGTDNGKGAANNTTSVQGSMSRCE